MKDFRGISRKAKQELGEQSPGRRPEPEPHLHAPAFERSSGPMREIAPANRSAQLPLGLIMGPTDAERGPARFFHIFLNLAVWCVILRGAVYLLQGLPIEPMVTPSLPTAILVYCSLLYLCRLCLGLKLFSLFFPIHHAITLFQIYGGDPAALLLEKSWIFSIFVNMLTTYLFIALPCLFAVRRPLALIPTLLTGSAVIALMPFVSGSFFFILPDAILPTAIGFAAAAVIAAGLHLLYYRQPRTFQP